MRYHRNHLSAAVFLAAACLAVSCARLRGDKKPAEAPPVAAQEAVNVKPSQEEREAKLRSVVKDWASEATRGQEERKTRLISKRPYFYKEYVEYPDKAEVLDLVIQEQESRTAPCVADVKLKKLRFATRFHRKRDDARADANFLRDTGTETLSFELRNNRWVKTGSLFVAEKTEENVNGEWVPLREQVERTVAAEEPTPGWFGKIWSRITGR